MIHEEGLFPIRLLGFGFHWAWLLLIAISPSPMFGQLYGIFNAPFEISELLFRLLFLMIVILLSSKLASKIGKQVLLCLYMIIGPLSILGLLAFSTPVTITAMSAFIALAETAAFVLWLCFFGYMKLGSTLMLLVNSYAIGAGIFLLVSILGKTAIVAACVLLPLISGLFFVLCDQYAANKQNDALFDNDGPTQRLRLTRPMKRMVVALVVYSFIFSFYSCVAVLLPLDYSAGSLVQSICWLFIAGAFALYAYKRGYAKPYLFYRVVPLLMGLGFLILAICPVFSPLAAFLVITGFLLFQVLSLNDFCNIAKTNDASLIRIITFARLTVSGGMFVGWVVGIGAIHYLNPTNSVIYICVISLFIILATAASIFSEKDLSEFNNIAEERNIQEVAETTQDFASHYEQYAKRLKLSQRESEVLELMLSGRNANYIAGKLCIADSTARTHIHNILTKSGVHSKMELLDQFEKYCEDQNVSQR